MLFADIELNAFEDIDYYDGSLAWKGIDDRSGSYYIGWAVTSEEVEVTLDQDNTYLRKKAGEKHTYTPRRFIVCRMSAARYLEFYQNKLTLHEAYKGAEDGHVWLATEWTEGYNRNVVKISCSDLTSEHLPMDADAKPYGGEP
jgi:hypothetical protein